MKNREEGDDRKEEAEELDTYLITGEGNTSMEAESDEALMESGGDEEENITIIGKENPRSNSSFTNYRRSEGLRGGWSGYLVTKLGYWTGPSRVQATTKGM